MTTVSMDFSASGPEEPAAVLSLAEATAAIRALPAADKIAVMKAARFLARKTPYGHEDLLQEAICRVLSGTRVWPRHLAARRFLGGVVRSIASEWKSTQPDNPPDRADPDAEERRVIAGLDVAKVFALFENDPVAQMIVRGMMEGARGQELQELSGLEKTAYESKRTKIRRYLEKLCE